MSTKAANRKKSTPAFQITDNAVSTPSGMNFNLADVPAWTLDKLIQTADILQKQGKKNEVNQIYSTWVSRTTSPHKFIGCFNYGVLLATWGQDE